jgi:hypothetical protein
MHEETETLEGFNGQLVKLSRSPSIIEIFVKHNLIVEMVIHFVKRSRIAHALLKTLSIYL